MIEYWDIYDQDRNLTGRIHQRGIPLKEGDFHLVVNIWIRNSNHEILLTKRHPDKPWGNYWECTGGSVIAGENSFQGALREVMEEIGVDLSDQEGVLLKEERRKNDFLDTWLFEKDISLNALTLQDGEVIDAMWVSEELYTEMYNKGMIVNLIENFYDMYHEYQRK